MKDKTNTTDRNVCYLSHIADLTFRDFSECTEDVSFSFRLQYLINMIESFSCQTTNCNYTLRHIYGRLLEKIRHSQTRPYNGGNRLKPPFILEMMISKQCVT